jgi:hypothetical protein
MINNYLDRSNYVKGLLLLIGKDKKITDSEKAFLHNIGETLGFDKKFIERAINELFENKYLGNEPPIFSQKHYAEAFLRDAIQLALVDNDLSREEFDWLHSIAESNDLSEAWLNNQLEYYLSGKYSRGSQKLQIENIFDTVWHT